MRNRRHYGTFSTNMVVRYKYEFRDFIYKNKKLKQLFFFIFSSFEKQLPKINPKLNFFWCIINIYKTTIKLLTKIRECLETLNVKLY